MTPNDNPHQPMAASELATQLELLQRDGYVVLEGLLARERCAALKQELLDLTDKTGANAFEGYKTQRVYAPLSKTRAIDDFIDHPRILALLDALFMPNHLLSQAQIINILPGESPQALHHDDAFYHAPRPAKPVHAAFIAAIDAFTEENGATVVVPGSHRWGERVPQHEEAIPCAMAPGSAVFFLGSLWHGGGANRSEHARLAVTGQYCEPWLRQQENFFLELTKEQARDLREPIRSMVGYSIHPPFMGMVDRHHPRKVLGL
jgi:ectoine hydroxylase-related dioxygenase (phytanoyl-CoA dioxygenase family)